MKSIHEIITVLSSFPVYWQSRVMLIFPHGGPLMHGLFLTGQTGMSNRPTPATRRHLDALGCLLGACMGSRWSCRARWASTKRRCYKLARKTRWSVPLQLASVSESFWPHAYLLVSQHETVFVKGQYSVRFNYSVFLIISLLSYQC